MSSYLNELIYHLLMAKIYQYSQFIQVLCFQNEAIKSYHTAIIIPSLYMLICSFGLSCI